MWIKNKHWPLTKRHSFRMCQGDYSNNLSAMFTCVKLCLGVLTGKQLTFT